MPDNILIVGSESILKRTLTSALREANFEVNAVSDCTEALVKVADNKPDLVVMEVSLDNPDDVEICCRIHRDNSIPLVLIGGDSGDIVWSMMMTDAIADLYVTKPFSCIVLVAQIKAILRRYKIVFNSRSQHE